MERLRISNYTLLVKYKIWDKEEETRGQHEVDINCNSEYMLGVMLRVGKAIYSAYHWVNNLMPICLFPDKTGGH